MNDPLYHAIWKIRDTRAEDAVLSGLIRWPAVTAPAVRAMGLCAADFSQHHTAKLFEVAMWVAAAATQVARLTDVYDEVVRRGLEADLGGGRFAARLAELWLGDYHPADIGFWWGEAYDDLPHQAGVALAMAAKVRHLAARREAAHKAMTRYVDAVAGVHSTDTYEED